MRTLYIVEVLRKRLNLTVSVHGDTNMSIYVECLGFLR